MSEWPGRGRREAHWHQPTYALRGPLSAWIREEAQRAHQAYGEYGVLDVGCGVKPYYPFFEPYVSQYVGVDLDNPAAELEGTIESIPAEDASFDVVLSTQVLEHCLDPVQAVREMHRVTRAGGRVIASTHGVYVYHPAPTDNWRWTHTGLERLFSTSADWTSVSVTAGCGTTATLGMLISIYVDLIFKNLRVRAAGRPFISAINHVAAAIDARSAKLRDPAMSGSLIGNFHVVAVR